jgi:plastocyanin
VRRALAIAITSGVMLVVGAPAGAVSRSVDVADIEYKPHEVRIAPGETVTWHFRGALDHTVTSDPGQAETFSSGGPRSGGPDFVHQFTKLGRYTYTCTVHPEMTGAVRVAPPDFTAPSLTRLSARPSRFCVPGRGCRHPGTRLRFRLSEGATVRGSIATVRHPGRRLRRLRAQLGAGRRSIRLRGRGLHAGRYLVRLQATDDSGNRSAVKTVRMRIKSP